MGCMTAAVSLRAPVALRAAAGARRQTAARACVASSSFSSTCNAVPASPRVAGLGRANTLGGGAISIATRTAPVGRRLRVVAEAAAIEGGEESTANISRKVARTASACKLLGRWGFWSQLVLTTISAVILVFSFLFKGFTKVSDARPRGIHAACTDA